MVSWGKAYSGAQVFFDIGMVAGDHQQALCVVAARRPDGVDEKLLHAGEGGVGCLLRPGVLEVRFFVQSFALVGKLMEIRGPPELSATTRLRPKERELGRARRR